MSVEAVNYVSRVKVGDSTAKFVLTRLADHADEEYSCLLAVGLIAAEVEKSDRTVQRALALLRDLRLVSDREAFWADGSQTTSRYVLHGPWDAYGGTGVPFLEIDRATVKAGSTTNGVSKAKRLKVFARDGYRCLACGTPEALTIDHIKHRSRGGRHNIENLRTLCRSCNSRRGAGYLPGVDL